MATIALDCRAIRTLQSRADREDSALEPKPAPRSSTATTEKASSLSNPRGFRKTLRHLSRKSQGDFAKSSCRKPGVTERSIGCCFGRRPDAERPRHDQEHTEAGGGGRQSGRGGWRSVQHQGGALAASRGRSPGQRVLRMKCEEHSPTRTGVIKVTNITTPLSGCVWDDSKVENTSFR